MHEYVGQSSLGTPKIQSSPKIEAPYGMKKYENKICLPTLVPEVELFVYIWGKNAK